LRQFIEAIFPQEFPYPGDPVVVSDSRAGLICPDGGIFHAAELIDREGGAGDAEAVRFEENGTPAGEFDGDGDQQADRRQEEQHQRCEDDIERPFKEPVSIVIQRKGPHLEQRNFAQVANFEMHLLVAIACEVGNQVSPYAISFSDGDEVFDGIHFAQGKGDEGVFEGSFVEDLLKLVNRADHVVSRTIQPGCGMFCQHADRFDAKVFIVEEIVLQLDTQFVISNDDGRFEVEVGLEKIAEKEPGGHTEFQQEEQRHRTEVLAFGADRPVRKEQEQGCKGKIINKTPDEGPGHFTIIQFKIPQIFNEKRADDDIAGVQDD